MGLSHFCSRKNPVYISSSFGQAGSDTAFSSAKCTSESLICFHRKNFQTDIAAVAILDAISTVTSGQLIFPSVIRKYLVHINGVVVIGVFTVNSVRYFFYVFQE